METAPACRSCAEHSATVAPRRHNVVNQQHALARHVTDALEGPDDVSPSLFRRRHGDLRRGVAGAGQDSAFNRYAGRLRDAPGEKLGLVVASFPLPAGVQGNGRDSVGADRLIRKVCRHQLGQPGRRRPHVSVLERIHQLLHDAGPTVRRRDTIEGLIRSLAPRAEGRATRRGAQTALRRFEPGNGRLALVAEIPSLPSASCTGTREYQVEQRRRSACQQMHRSELYLNQCRRREERT